jgi:hypothetical protein
LISPFAGTVEATVEAVVSGAMNAVGVVVVVVVGVLAAGVLVAVELLLLLELPHADSASAASGTAKIIFLLTGFVLSLGELRAYRARGVDLAQGVPYPAGPQDAKTDAFLPARPAARRSRR